MKLGEHIGTYPPNNSQPYWYVAPPSSTSTPWYNGSATISTGACGGGSGGSGGSGGYYNLSNLVNTVDYIKG